MMLTLLGVLGVGGFAAASFFVPAFLPMVLSAAGAILRCKPCLIALAIAAAFLGGEIRGDLRGSARGKAEIQTKWDREKAQAAAARAREKVRQAAEASRQQARDAAAAADVAKRDKDELAAIAGAAVVDDGPVRKVMRDSWARERASMGLK